MRQSHRLILNVLSNYATFVIYGVVNFLLVGYIVHKLGRVAFGLVSLVFSITMITEILGRGICQALIKHISAAISKGEEGPVNEYVSTSLVWFTICGIIGGAICGIAAVYVDRLFRIPPELVTTAKSAMWLMAFRVMPLFPFNSFQGILFAHQHYDLANLSKSVTTILRAIGVVIYFELFGGGVLSLINITIISLLLERISWVWFAMRLDSHLHLRLSSVTWTAMVTLVSFGGFMLIIDVANLVGYEAVKWVIGFELSVQDVGGYTLIAVPASFAGSIVRAVAGVLVPVASKYDAIKRHDLNASLALLSTKYGMIMSSALCIIPLMLVRPLLTLWVGSKYPAEYLANLAIAGVILLLGQWFIGMAVCLLQMLTGVGRVRFPAAVTVAWAVGGLTGVWLYLHWIQNSLIAAVVGITIARIVGSLIHIGYGLHVMKVSPVSFLKKAIMRPAAAALIPFAASVILVSYINPYSIPKFAVTASILTILCVISTWIVALDSTERNAVIGKLKVGFKKVIAPRTDIESL